MNCKYCQRPLTLVYTEKHQPPTTVFRDYMCHECHVHDKYIIVDLEEPFLSSQIFYRIIIKEKEFRVIFQLVPQCTFVRVIVDNPKYGEPLEPETINEDVFQLSFIPPNWTPTNIKQKLELLLPFI